MSVEVTNETIWDIDAKAFSDLGLWVMDQMRVSTQSDLTILFVDPDPIAELHERWMSLEGPTDVMSFPMMLLTIHGILHLLGYDHVTPEQERQMFGLQRQLLLTFLAVRRITIEPATLPKGAADALAEYDASHGGGRQITE